MKTIYFLMLTASIAFVLSCKKETLPPETQTGANTFGCLIDGKVFVPHSGVFGPPVTWYGYYYRNGGFYLQVVASNTNNNTLVGIYTDSMRIREKGVYPLINKTPNAAYGVYNYSPPPSFNSFQYTNRLAPGELTITKCDSIAHILSGTFWFNVIDSSSGKLIKITDGRFDIRY